MFSESKKKINEATRGQSNRIGKSTNINGDVVSKSDFRIDGKLEGSVETSGKIVIGTSGTIIGKVICENADMAHIAPKLIKKCKAEITIFGSRG